MAVSNADIQAWLAANPGASDAAKAAKMQEFGVTPEQMAQASGANLADVQARYTAATAPAATAPAPTNGLDQQHIDAARSWITDQWGIPKQTANPELYSAAFDANGAYNGSDLYRNRAVLGAGLAQGYNTDQMSQILSIPASQIAAYAQSLPASTLQGQADLFNKDQSDGFYQTGKVANTGRTSDTYTKPYAITKGDEGSTAYFNGGGSQYTKGDDAYAQLIGLYGQPTGQRYTGPGYTPPGNYDFAGLGYLQSNPAPLIGPRPTAAPVNMGLLSGTAPVKTAPYTPLLGSGSGKRTAYAPQPAPTTPSAPSAQAAPWLQTISGNLMQNQPTISGIRANPFTSNLGFGR